ncbi:MAG: glycosyltransferase family 2 protein [Bosea sp. (in: a-proteobacteria)]|uniref:glycosyltransferase family 2 protein n=1 Tax=Bosea sp. (in: a-proteobacteria) TaxID=1871050 RepID=UPI0027342DFC|nr:glycosyltransferase family 2 protein [Bosea sp. (in: a-proteobacteria)]MDP3258116.1 glycosyltransferase family 2 protein [Bosea sp. (in: a-proteobacteria)]MDP3317921.1 glycosyltransferase family 2 protein [Bosea sp. (in: a-proteobacteria)]
MQPPSASPAPPGQSSRPELSIVVPVHNEADNLPLLFERLKQVLDGAVTSWELVCVDDGSRDGTLAVLRLLASQDRRVSAVSFSRNFGKEIAIAAGLDHASGNAVVIMDADLQHPPETILVFLEKWREGYLNVYGQRSDRDGETRLKRNFAKVFYRLFARFGETELPEGAGDFRLLDRKVVDALRALPERARFSKGLYAWVGFRSTGVTFDVAEREHGVSKFRYRKLFSFAFDGLSSFSTVPLKIATWAGVVIAVMAAMTALFFVLRTLFFGTDLPGFPSLIVSIMFFSGIQLVSLGMIGEYVGRIFAEVKRRPLYLIGERVGFDARTVDHPRGDALPPLIR